MKKLIKLNTYEKRYGLLSHALVFCVLGILISVFNKDVSLLYRYPLRPLFNALYVKYFNGKRKKRYFSLS